MKKNYQYKETAEIINRFQATIKDDPELTEKSKASYLKSAPLYLHPIFKDVDISRLERYEMGRLLNTKTQSASKKSARNMLFWARKFLTFLVDAHYYSDNRFDFLKYYSFYFSTRDNSIILKVLLGEIYKHNSTAEAVHAYLQAITTSDTLPTSHAMSYAKRTLSDILCDVEIASMDRFQLGTLMKERLPMFVPQYQCEAYKNIRKFLLYLIEIQFYHDGRFDYLQNYSDYLNSLTVNSLIIDLLLVPHTFQYRIIPPYSKSSQYLLYIGSKSEEVCSVIAEAFALSRMHITEVTDFIKNFEHTLLPFKTTSITDLNWDTFCSQCSYLQRIHSSKKTYSFLVTFYNLIAQKYNADIFANSMIDSRLLTRQDLAPLLHDGYKLVSYNPSEQYPDHDKLIICFYGEQKNHSSNFLSASKSFDFSSISTPYYKALLKDYLWHGSASPSSKINTCLRAIHFFRYLEDLYIGEKLSIYYTRQNDINIRPGDCMAYVQHVHQTFKNVSTSHAYIKSARIVLQHALDTEYDWVAQTTLYYLFAHTDNVTNNSNPINDDDLNNLCCVVNKQISTGDVVVMELACIFYLLITTEFRLSQILNLHVDCVKATMKQNEFILISSKKTSAGEQVETAITSNTAKHIERIVAITEKWRAQCTHQGLTKKLFIVPANRFHTYSSITARLFNRFLEKCCQSAGIERYTAANLRDTHMTKAAECRARNRLSEFDQLILTDHTSTETDTRHYIKTDIIELLEAAYGIIIGDVPIAGHISNDTDNTSAVSQSVANQCGYCGKDACESYSYVSCLLCKDFIATPSHMPFFTKEIERIDIKLRQDLIPHDREDLQNIKRLLLAYLARLISKEDFNATGH